MSCSPLSSPWHRLREEDEGEQDESTLQKWRHLTFVLNAAQRFRCSLDNRRLSLQVSPLRAGSSNKLKLGTNALRAIYRFKEAGKKARLDPSLLVKNQDSALLRDFGGVDGVVEALSTNKNSGLQNDVHELRSRRLKYGSNTYPRPPSKPFFLFLWDACRDVTLIILTICAFMSLVLALATKGDWYDGASIACTVVLVILVTACSDFKQSLQFRSLNKEKRRIHLQVLREGRSRTVSIYDIVVGDIVPLNTGDQIPADGLFISGHSLLVDESSMTGESEPVHKDVDCPFLLSGCKVMDGYGVMLITGVGMDTEWGRAMASLTEDLNEETPLQVRLNGAATAIGIIGLAVAILCFLMLFVRYFVHDYRKNKKPVRVLKKNVDMLSIAVTIIVVAVPEGLPLAVTLTLAYSMRKMMNEKSLVRHLSACETMGSATTICTDKTGTLTLNQMTVVDCWIAGCKRTPEGISRLPIAPVLIDGIAFNTTGGVYIPLVSGIPEVNGSPTERALLNWGLSIGMDFEATRNKCLIVHVEPFNSVKKQATVVIKHEDGTICAHWKGAAEMILEICESWLDAEGCIKNFSVETKHEMQCTIAEMAARSLRCIAFACKPDQNMGEHSETGLVLTSVVGIKDPCRLGVVEAVAICKSAGIRVRMVTGDNAVTAKAIASDCGILLAGGLVVEGAEFRRWTEEERREMLPTIDVLARSSPTDKLLLVKSLKNMNEVVAVTGDGTNDAPALREAHIGLSMGLSGTEVAKESSDIVILDDNFSSVVNVVRWGRSVYENIQKFIQFQLTVNVAALLTNVIAAARSDDVPLNTVQLLWVNLIMDTLAALALATEPPSDDVMLRTPIGLRDPLVSNVMWRNILGQASYQVLLLSVLYFNGYKILRLSNDADGTLVKNTVVFNAFVFCQVFNEINARKLQKLNVFKGILRSPLFCTVVVLTCVVQIIIVEFLQKFFKTTALPWQYWLVSIGIGLLSIPLGCLLKLVKVPEKPIVNTNWRRKQQPRLPEANSAKSEDEHIV